MALVAAPLLALITPFTDTVYLPALTSVSSTLNASNTLVALTVSIYLACVGIGQLFWGPLSDRYCRLPTLYVGVSIYLAFTLICIFSTTIVMLLILRALQGLIVGCTICAAQSIVADIFPHYERRQATGSFLAPMLVGPIIAPIIGGVLSQHYGWRATMVLLLVLSTPIALLGFFTIPETHHYHVMQRLMELQVNGGLKNLKQKNVSNQAENEHSRAVEYTEVKDGSQVDIETSFLSKSQQVVEEERATTDIEEVEESNNNNDDNKQGKDDNDKDREDEYRYEAKRALEIYEFLHQHDSPNNQYAITAEDLALHQETGDASYSQRVLLLLTERDTILEPTALEMPWSALSLVLENELAPFYWSQFLAFGIMFATLTLLPLLLSVSPYNLSESLVGVTYLAVGFRMLCGALYGGSDSDRSALAYPQHKAGRMVYSTCYLPLVVLGAMGYAYALQYGQHISLSLISQFVLGFGQSVHMSSSMSYISAARPDRAGSANSVLMFLCFGGGAVSIAISVPLSSAVTLAGFFWILSGLLVLTITWSMVFMYYNLHNDSSSESSVSAKKQQSIVQMTLTPSATEIDLELKQAQPQSRQEGNANDGPPSLLLPVVTKADVEDKLYLPTVTMSEVV